MHEFLFGERFTNSHRAREDVHALLRCYKELVNRGEISNFTIDHNHPTMIKAVGFFFLGTNMIKSAYSFRKAVGKIPEIAERVKEIGWNHFPLADFCSSYGFGYLETECKKFDLKPIFGATIPVTSNQSKKPIT